jgi:hypothetical protein
VPGQCAFVPDVQRELTEGEAWTREQLATLLAAASARARWRGSSPRRRPARTPSGGAPGPRAPEPAVDGDRRGAYALRAAARRGAPREAAGAAAWWAATAVMLDWHLGMLETPEGEPRPLRPADACTLARAWLVPVVAARPSPATCALGALSDVADGRLARAAGKPTRAGRDLEGLVDFCFAVAALRGLVRDGRLGRPVVAAEVARTSAGFGYALFAYFGRAERPRRRPAAPRARHDGRAGVGARRRRRGPPAPRRRAGRRWLGVEPAELSRAARTRASSRGPAASP